MRSGQRAGEAAATLTENAGTRVNLVQGGNLGKDFDKKAALAGHEDCREAINLL